MIKHKHPWEYKMKAVKVEKPTAEEMEDLLKRATSKDEKEIKPSAYTSINGIPHKMTKDRGWVPLTRIN